MNTEEESEEFQQTFRSSADMAPRKQKPSQEEIDDSSPVTEGIPIVPEEVAVEEAVVWDPSVYEESEEGTIFGEETEINTKIAELNAAEPMKLLRLERDRLLATTDWRASSDLTLSDAWKNYRQALRDLPASASPTLNSDYNLDKSSVTWPTKPS